MSTQAYIPKWDGSHLGDFKANEISYHSSTNDDETLLPIWTIKHDNLTFTAMVKSSKDQFPCLADELKPLFGLLKLGTHMIKVGGKSYLLIKPPSSDCKDVKLSNPTDGKVSAPSSLLKKQVRSIYAFRYLIGMNNSNDSHIYIRHLKGFAPVPISYIDTCPAGDKHTKKSEINPLSLTVINKWFDNCDLSTTVKSIIGYGSHDKLPVIIMELTGKIEEVINRVNKEYIWITAFIVDRVCAHLTS